jgi:cytochrome c-type biogenesis protein CcmH/NrfG
MLSAYVKEVPSDGAGFMSLARAYLRSGSILQALGAARQALQLNPGSTEAQSLLNELISR